MQKIRIQGIMYDERSSFLRGCSEAPPLIRKFYHSEHSNYFSEDGLDSNHEAVSEGPDHRIKDYFEIEEITTKELSSVVRIISLGGDHSITYPILKAFHPIYPKIDILHIDAHPDLYADYEGDRYSHACPFARIMEDQLATRLVQIGIRSINPHQEAQSKKFKTELIRMKDFGANFLPEFKNPVYCSIDLDGIDPAFAPGVSHPEPGGLTSREVIKLIQSINTPLVGADIVEYNPRKDLRDLTAILAAKILKELIGKMLETIPLLPR